ncbi:hypothetical protein ABPG77_004752 [Micractinium sp. CCAP 211/92]
MSGAHREAPRGGHANGSATKSLNQAITQAATLQDLVQVVVINFGHMNPVNFCTAYHRIAKHVEDMRRGRSPPESWPPMQQQQLGGLLTELNTALLPRLEEVQAHNLGLTLWSISKTCQVAQAGTQELVDALQAEITSRLNNATRDVYLRDKHYNFGAQALSNIIYSAATMGLRPSYELLNAVGRGVAWQVEDFKPQGLANIVWGLGKMGVKVTHEVRQMVEVLGREMTAQLTHARHKGSVAPQNVSNMLHGLTNIGVTPAPELLSALARCADGMLRQFGPQELTNTVWSFSQMSKQGVALPPDVNALLDRVPDEVLLLFGDRAWRARVRPQTISNLAIAYAHLRRAPQMLMMELTSEAVPMLAQFKPQELSNLLWAMATMAFYPGASTVDSISRAAGAAAERMKPQEIANTCWAWATMRHFPGAATLDAVLAHAEAQLDRFKSQELGMLTWAVAKLGYMPAARLVRAALPHVAAARSPAVQDCGNLLWAFTVLDILTPDVMQLLAEKLLSLPREAFTQEAYIQLYQAKMSLSQQVFDIAQYIPPELLAQAETEWRRQSGEYKVSVTHRDVASVMHELSIDFEMEKKIEDGLMSVDIALRGEMVAVEVDGAAHFTMNEPFVPLGRTIWRWRLLASRGWRVVTVPYFRWGLMQTLAQKKQYLYTLLQAHSVWDCFSLDPQDRDAPFRPPANLAHLTPDEVFQLAEQGIAPSSLAAASAGTTPAFSPATPLPAGLGPAVAGGSASSTGLPAGLLPMPVSLVPQGAGLSTQAQQQQQQQQQQGGGYGRLPDNLYASEGGLGGSRAPSGPSRLGSASSSSGGLNISARPFSFGGSGGLGGPPGLGRLSSSTASMGAAPTASGPVAYLGRVSGSPAVGGLASAGSASASPTASSSLLRQSGGSGSYSASPYTLAPTAPAFTPSLAALPPSDLHGSPVLQGSGLGDSSGGSVAASRASSATASPALLQALGGRAGAIATAGNSSPSHSPSPPPVAALRGLSLSPLNPASQLVPPRLAPPDLPHLEPLGSHQLASPSLAATAAAPALGRLSGRPSSAGEGSAAVAFVSAGTAGSLALGGGLDSDPDDDAGDLRAMFGAVIGTQPAQPARALSVEEVRRKLALLPPEAAIADVAPTWLAGWDATTVVELLRQLDSPTTAARALQLFDWLRGLPAESPLAHLCTPGAYAAMIELFGKWRKPKQAVRLFAELKERGEDDAEVHSALVEAFCRCGQAEVAMDAHRNMLALGLPPSPAAARAMLGVHMQRGAWEEVDFVLAGLVEAADRRGSNGLEAAGEDGSAAGSPGLAGTELQLDAELYNWVIDAACAAGNASAAQSAFDRMCQAGVAPTSATFAALLGALRHDHSVAALADLSLALAEQADAAAAGASAGTRPAALHALLQACSLRGWWDLSMRLLQALEESGASPSVEEVNEALAACATAGAVDDARQLFEGLGARGLQPTTASYLALVKALCAAGQWAAGAAEYEAMLEAGLSPSEELVSLVVDALWCSGLPWAQVEAIGAFNRAIREHWLLPAQPSTSRGLLKLDLRSRHLGTGVLRMRRWLHDMRGTIGNSSAACILDQTKRMCIVNTAPNGMEAAAASQLGAALKAALGASLVAHKAPFRLSFEGGRAVRMESATFMIKKWLFTEQFQDWERACGGHSALAAGAGGAASLDAAADRDAGAHNQCAQTFATIREHEAAHPPDPSAPGLAPGAGYAGQRRSRLAEAARHLAAGRDANGALWHGAVVLLDRCAAAGHTPGMEALLAAACVALAAQQGGIPLEPAALAGQLDPQVTMESVGLEPEPALAAEMAAVVAALQGDTACISAVHCWEVFAERLGCDVHDENQVSALLGDSLQRLHSLALGQEHQHLWFTHPPSILAAAVVLVGRKERGLVPAWPTPLQQLTGYKEDLHPEFAEVLQELQSTSQYGSAMVQTVFS